MDSNQQRQVAYMTKKYFSVFSKTKDDIEQTCALKHRIPIVGAQPTKQPLRRVQENR